MEEVKTVETKRSPKYQPGQRVYFLYQNTQERQEIVPGVVLSHAQNGRTFVYNVRTVSGTVTHQEHELLTSCDHVENNKLARFEQEFAALPASARRFLRSVSADYEVSFQQAGAFATMRSFLEAFELDYSPYYVAQALEMMRAQQ
ncbi:MAG: hypothetical protein WBA12_05675 [Catalinimonas sp.]